MDSGYRSTLKIGPMPLTALALATNPQDSWLGIRNVLQGDLPDDPWAHFGSKGIRQLSSMPSRRALHLLGVHRRHEVVSVARKAAAALDRGFPLQKIFRYLSNRVEQIIQTGSSFTGQQTHPDLIDSLRAEASLHIWGLMIKWSKNSARDVRLLDTTMRDWYQSEVGRGATIERLEWIFEQFLLDPHHPEIFQTGGGATTQFGLIEGLVGDFKRSPFELHRRLMAVHKKVFTRTWYKLRGRTVPRALMVRFEEGPERHIPDESEVASHFPDTPNGQRLKRLYFVRQVALRRGKYGDALVEQNYELLARRERKLHECGLDAVQVFDFRNWVPNIVFGCNAAREGGMEIIPCLHPGPNFKGDYEKIVKLMLEALGSDVLAFGIKDAPGLIQPDLAHSVAELLESLLPKGMAIQFHSHDTGGTSLLSYIAFALGLSEDRVLYVDGCLGESQRAQARLQSMAIVFKAAGWTKCVPSKTTMKTINDAQVALLEELRAEGQVSPAMPPDKRIRIIKAGMAGGATETLAKDIGQYVRGMLRQFELADTPANQAAMLEGLFEAVLYRQATVAKALGYPLEVTPGMNWLAQMTLFLVVDEIQAKKYTVAFTQPGGNVAFSFGGELGVESWRITPTWMNHLWEVMQLDELREQCPADAALLNRAYRDFNERLTRLGLRIGEENGTHHPDIGTIDSAVRQLAETLGRPCVDSLVLDVAEKLSARLFEELSLQDIADITGNPLFMSMEAIEAKFWAEGMDEEQFLMVASYEALGRGFVDAIKKWQGVLHSSPILSDRREEAKTALANMGVHCRAIVAPKWARRAASRFRKQAA